MKKVLDRMPKSSILDLNKIQKGEVTMTAVEIATRRLTDCNSCWDIYEITGTTGDLTDEEYLSAKLEIIESRIPDAIKRLSKITKITQKKIKSDLLKIAFDKGGVPTSQSIYNVLDYLNYFSVDGWMDLGKNDVRVAQGMYLVLVNNHNDWSNDDDDKRSRIIDAMNC